MRFHRRISDKFSRSAKAAGRTREIAEKII
jgi:hypothetical protein